VGVLVALVVMATTSGCGLAGFSEALAHPEAQQPADVPPTPVAPVTPADQPRVIAEGTLLSGGQQAGTVRVTLGMLETGLVPPVALFGQDCPVSGPSLQYVPVSISYSLDRDVEGGLAGHLTAAPGPATPAGIGDLGVFFRPSQDDDTPACADYPPLPTTDTFWARGTSQTTGYVVLDQAVGPATPQGRAEVFPTLQVRLDDLRIRTYGGHETPLTLGALTAGTACDDDDGAFCVALG
jgi:hypothetical protein